MKNNVTRYGFITALLVAVAACSGAAPSPTSPSAAIGGSSGATSGAAALKATAPAIISPIDGITLATRRPSFHWANAAGTYEAVGLAYEIEVSAADGTVVYSQTVGETPDTGVHEIGLDLPYDIVHAWRVRAVLSTSAGPWSIYGDFRTPKPPPPPTPIPTAPTSPTGGGTYRTPDPPPGQRLPRPNHSGHVQAFSAANPGYLRNSCQDSGGNWAFMDGVVDTLRNVDLRYGYNCKRGNCNDISKDVISYHYGAGPDEGSTQVYCTDLIGGHCGSNPSLVWNDVTTITVDSGTVCKVTANRPGRR